MKKIHITQVYTNYTDYNDYPEGELRTRLISTRQGQPTPDERHRFRVDTDATHTHTIYYRLYLDKLEEWR